MSLLWDLSSISIQYFTGEKPCIQALEYKVPKASKYENSEEGAIILETSGNPSGVGGREQYDTVHFNIN